MAAQSCLHRGSDAQCLVDPAKVVVHEVKRNSMAVVFDLLREPVRQTGKTAHAHPHREILTLHKARADMVWVRVSAHGLHVTADAGSFMDQSSHRQTGCASPVDFKLHHYPEFRWLDEACCKALHSLGLAEQKTARFGMESENGR
jgi:hypothetical protein